MAELSRWFVVHTYSGYENKVATNIEKVVENRKMHDLILDVNIPMETVTEVKDEQKKEVERKVFPGYVMVKVAVFENEDTGELEMTDDTWYVIRNTRGVTGFVGPESKPIPLTEEEVYAMGVEKKVIKIDYEVGDMVTIIDGAFEGVVGVGRETPVELELDQVEKTEQE